MSASISFTGLLLYFGLLLVPPTFFLGYAAGQRRFSLRMLFAFVTAEAIALALLTLFRWR